MFIFNQREIKLLSASGPHMDLRMEIVIFRDFSKVSIEVPLPNTSTDLFTMEYEYKKFQNTLKKFKLTI